MIIAVDFDGVLCEDRFPEIGDPHMRVIQFVRILAERGHEVILWTCRAGRRLDEALEWCDRMGLEFSAVNENAPSNREAYAAEYPDPSPKVYADLYLEDHCPFFQHMAQGSPGWAEGRMLEYAINYVNRYGMTWNVNIEGESHE